MNVQVSVQPTASSSDVGGGGGGNDSERGRARRPRMYGDPAIWGEETPALAPEQVLQHMPDIRIQELSCHDPLFEAWTADLKQIHADTFPVRYQQDFFNNLQQWNFKTTVAVDYSSALPRPTVVGVATGRMELRKYLVWCQAFVPARVLKTGRAWIMTLAVSPAYRRCAIASQILSTLMAVLACSEVLLHCTDTNAKALRLYRRNNFRVVERLDKHYHFNGSWHNALLLSRSLESASPV